MSRISTVARFEFLTAVRSKAFIVGVVLMPVLMFGTIAVQTLASKQVDMRDRRFAVIDHSGALAGAIEAAAGERNAAVSATPVPRFVPERLALTAGESAGMAPATQAELSNRVRTGNLFAFVEIPAGVLAVDTPPNLTIRYYSDTPSYRELSQWLGATLNNAIRARRFAMAHIDQRLVEHINAPVRTVDLGLAQTTETGEIAAAAETDAVTTFVVPMMLMMLLYMVVMSSAPKLLNTVLEEKMGRITEVLLGSVTPFDLMMGKLIGSVGVSGVLGLLYLGGGYVVASHLGYAGAIEPRMIAWFVLFLVLAVFMFGSMFLAIGSACSELKDAQNLMMPAMLVVMLPMLTMTMVMQSPDGTASTVLSLFPPCTPMLMLLRLALRPGPPWWQLALAVVLTTLTTVFGVWAASRIFRIGLLLQGRPATYRDMLRWVFSSS